jgi:hypothetical protein
MLEQPDKTKPLIQKKINVRFMLYPLMNCLAIPIL